MLQLTIDEDGVMLSGTERGNQAHRALVPRPWRWSRSAGGWVLPRSLLPMTRQRHVDWLIRQAATAGLPLEVEDSSTVQSESDRRQDRTDRLEHRADRHEAVAARAARTSDAPKRPAAR